MKSIPQSISGKHPNINSFNHPKYLISNLDEEKCASTNFLDNKLNKEIISPTFQKFSNDDSPQNDRKSFVKDKSHLVQDPLIQDQYNLPRVFVDINIFISNKCTKQLPDETIDCGSMTTDKKQKMGSYTCTEEKVLAFSNIDSDKQNIYSDDLFRDSEDREYGTKHGKSILKYKFPYNARILAKKNYLAWKCICHQHVQRENGKFLKSSRKSFISTLKHYWQSQKGRPPIIYMKKLPTSEQPSKNITLNEILDLWGKSIGEEKNYL